MNKMKKLLSVVLAIVLALSCMSMTASAAKTSYQTVANLEALNAYSPYGQVTRLSLEERTSIVLDALDNLLPGLNINLGKVFDVLGLSVTIDLTSVDRLCYSFDTIKSTFNNTLASIAMGIVDLGILESLNVDNWESGMSRAGTAQWHIVEVLLSFLSSNKTLVTKVLTDGLDLGIVSLGDMSAVTDVIGDLPGLIKGLVWGLFERWDDTLTEIKNYDTSAKGNGGIESTLNTFVQNLFKNDMSITTIKYDANGNMTSEHTNWQSFATGSAAPGTPSANSPRCYYQFSSTTPGSVMTVYHIVDAAEAKTLAKTPDEVNGSAAAYTYFVEKQQFVMSQEVEGSETYVWKATDEFDNSWSLKWYNDDSSFLGDLGFTPDLAAMSAGELLYKFIPVVFKNMAPVVLNGSIKKILAELFGAKFTYVGQGGPEADDAVLALADSSNAFFTEEQGEYLWEWSNYAIINGTHYYRFEDQIFVGSLDNVNNYFDIINWNFKVSDDFMNEFIPTSDDDASKRILLNINDFLVKVAELVLLPSAATDDTRTDYTAQWTRPTFAKGNANLVSNIKALAQAFLGLAPQHIFGDDNYATNEKCYYDLMMSSDNDTVLVGIAATLVDAIMPSMSLPGKSDILASGAKVGAILAAVVREFAAYLAPEYNFDALIYTSFENGTKKFVTGKDSNYWFDVILTMGINVGFEYLRAFADMGEGTDEWNAFVSYSGYAPDGKTYAAMDTAALNAHWEGMLDYLLDWALDKDYEWTWKMENLVNTSGLTIDMTSAQDPFNKIQTILGAILPVDEILTVTPADGQTKFEHFLREDLILGIVDLKWDHLIETITLNGTNQYFRKANVLDQLATLVKGIVNSLFSKVGGSGYQFIPSVITDFDSLANQANITTLAANLVEKLHTALVSNKLADTVFPFLNFLLGWKTDPQQIADPKIWTSFRDGNDYAFQWKDNGVYPSIEADQTLIKILNNSAGMLEKHRNSSVTDHAYDIQIKSVTSDATVNTLTFTYSDGNGLISPYETIDIKVGGTYKGEEAATITIAYDYVGKDGKAIGGTQYTSLTLLFSNQYEDANIIGRWDGQDDDDYSGTDPWLKYVFTEDIYTTITEYQAHIFYVGSTFSNPSKSLGTIAAPDWTGNDCDGYTYYDITGQATNYFAFKPTDQMGFASTLSKDGTSHSYGTLYQAKAGVTADTEFPYGVYDMGRVAVAYGKVNKNFEPDFIYYNSYGIYDIYTENQWNGYNANQGVDAATYNEYNAAWRDIVKYATYPMMTEANGNAATDYVKTIQPYIPAAIERFEAAKKAYELALADAQASASDAASLPTYVEALQTEIDNDFVNGKEINFQDYNFYEYFNYNDVKVAAENLYRSYLAPEVMDKYYILNSGISEKELDSVIAAEANPFIKAGISASRLENDQAAIDASQAAKDEWKQPTTTRLIVDDFTSRLAFYKQFLAANAEPKSYNSKAAHMYFLEKEIAFVEAQGLVASDYEEVTWGRYADALATAKAVAAGTDEFSSFNSRIYDVKYNLMVAYKQLLKNADSLIQAGGTADLLANIDIANAIFASLAAGDGTWYLAADYEGEADDAYAALISALGYYYVGEDGNTWNLYADSALEYADNDRPNKQGNQAKVDAANAALEAAIANFETAAVMDPPTIDKVEDFEYTDYVVVDTANTNNDEFTGIIYGIDTLDQNEMMEQLATLAEALKASTGDETHIVITPNEQGNESTDALIEIVDSDGNVLETYVFVYFGDVDGDAMISANDAYIAEYYEASYEGISSYAQYVASDVDGDGMPSANDAYIMEYYEVSYEGVDYQYNLGQNAMNNPYEWIY